MKILLALLITLANLGLFAQQRTVYLSDILEEAIFSGRDNIVYQDIDVSTENIPDRFKLNVAKYLQSIHPNLPVDSGGRVIISSAIQLTSSYGDIRLNNLSFEEQLSIRDEEGTTSKPKSIRIDNCSFNGFSLHSSNTDELQVGNSRFGMGLSFSVIFDNIYADDYVNEFNPHFVFFNNDVAASYSDQILIQGSNAEILNNRIKGTSGSAFSFHELKMKKLNMRNNSFDSVKVFLIYSSIENLILTGNSLTNPFIFDENIIASRAVIINNVFEKFSMSQTILPELFVNFDWDQLKGNKLFINVDQTPAENPKGSFPCPMCLPYYGLTNEELARNDRFRELITVYAKLYRINKEDGDINSANGAYSELQDLYTRRYGYLSRTEGGLENWFKWRLNQLLEFYVVYGTAPARALVVSFYIILAFSIFYFFFPSEWDVTSKKKLMEQFKLTLDKKHKQKARPLLRTIGLFALSFVNAFTLSINSFVTLGFGTIPTRGLARYVCIIQGFIGWFLLSLFTVALINQVIF